MWWDGGWANRDQGKHFQGNQMLRIKRLWKSKRWDEMLNYHQEQYIMWFGMWWDDGWASDTRLKTYDVDSRFTLLNYELN
ncbi:hypothetical protein E3N88_45951 [Mikania micrantha]|uniref:Uncharacterized protein n=1 Tax=Mikania micrantha TaxID=192012 RepID=A0A5N6L7T5_9ASTR|nr:hypothetical protein E3N88_45951 [Mikania micrantha]